MRKSRLSDYKQDRLIEHFVSGSTALTAVRLCGMNPKRPPSFFYDFARSLLWSWKLKATPCSVARSKGTRVISAISGRGRASAVVVQPKKPRYLAFSSEAAGSTPRSFSMLQMLKWLFQLAFEQRLTENIKWSIFKPKVRENIFARQYLGRYAGDVS